MDSASHSYCDAGKPAAALRMMREAPEKWFQHLQALLSTRDGMIYIQVFLSTAMLRAESRPPLKWTLKQDKQLFEDVAWKVENDENCKKIVAEAGGTLVGFSLEPVAPSKWKSIKVAVNINVPRTVDLGCTWGVLGTQPAKIRIFKGPKETCEKHPWDAMILRDCRAQTDGFMSISGIISRKWDILLMKMCEDYDYPWVVVAMKDSGLDTDAQMSASHRPHAAAIRLPLREVLKF
ncbi:hypothetical protein F4824DRAFT_502240 [Ustulina deusta]|nr:hypothetical protein F4824DRAFT_502240 [Ustulina deusta]